MNNQNDKKNKLPDELDDLILDRLVDNELSDQEYREVLRLVEEKPDGWRKLAIAFLESQAFENELSGLHEVEGSDAGTGPLLKDDPFAVESLHGDSSQSENQANDSISDSPVPSTEHDKSQIDQRVSGQTETGEREPEFKPTKDDAGFWRSFRTALPAIAACFAIAFTVALYVREIQNHGNVPETNSAQGKQGNRAIDPGFIELVSNDSGGRVQTPVYNHQKFDPRSYAQDIDSLKPRLQEVVNRSGWSANEKTHVVPIKDSTGNRIIVPLKEINLKATNFEDYQ